MKSLLSIENKGITFFVFLFFFLIMLASSGGHLTVWDDKGYFLLTENIVKHHSMILYPDLKAPDDGQGQFSIRSYFSWQHALRNNQTPLPPGAKLEPTATNASPLLALIGVPFYIIAESIHYSPVKITSYFANSLIISLLATVIFAFGSEFYRSKKIGFAVALVASVCSLVWPYVSSYLEQPLSALTITSCLYFLFIATNRTSVDLQEQGQQRHTVPMRLVTLAPALAGLFLGLQSFAHPGTIVLIPGIAILAVYVFRQNKQKLLQFLAALFFLIALQLVVNEYRFGSIAEFGYGFTQSQPHIYTEGLYGLFLSPGFGLIVYFPLIALLPLAVYYLWRRNKVFCIAFLYVILSIWIFYGTLPGVLWIGLGGWGPRYMITIIPVLALTLGSVLSVMSSKIGLAEAGKGFNKLPAGQSRLIKNILKTTFIILAASGFLTNLLGVLVWYQLGFAYGYGYLHINQLPDQENSYKYFTWYIKYQPALLHWKILTTNWWKALRNIYPSYFGWAPCIPDNFLYCNFNLLSLTGMLVAVCLTGSIIAYILFKKRPYQVTA